MKRNLSPVSALFIFAWVILFTASCGKLIMQNESEKVSRSDQASESTEPQSETGRTENSGEETTLESTEIAFVAEPIYFEFDSSALSDHAPEQLTKIAGHLKLYPGSGVIAQGHCDERGADAYNMALGMRRAESAKTFLVQHGISSDRLRTMSCGETRPIAKGQNEAAWAKNRRVEFIIN